MKSKFLSWQHSKWWINFQTMIKIVSARDTAVGFKLNATTVASLKDENYDVRRKKMYQISSVFRNVEQFSPNPYQGKKRGENIFSR